MFHPWDTQVYENATWATTPAEVSSGSGAVVVLGLNGLSIYSNRHELVRMLVGRRNQSTHILGDQFGMVWPSLGL